MSKNLQSALEHSDEVSASLAAECEKGFMAGPHANQPFEHFHSSGLGTVPKKDGSWRLICHLSAPVGSSVNDSIRKDDFSLQYPTIDMAVAMIDAFQSPPYMVKVDLKHAFRQCSVHPQDLHLLGCTWQGQYYYHKRLPFGLRSSPFLFNQVAEAVQWILPNVLEIQHIIHYLDDFFILAVSEAEGHRLLDVVLTAFSRLGVEWAPKKVEGPSQCLSFLGIEIDTVGRVLRLPPC